MNNWLEDDRGNGDSTYHWKFDHEVREENLLSTLPLFLRCRNLISLELPLSEVRNRVDDDPRDATPKVYELKDV